MLSLSSPTLPEIVSVCAARHQFAPSYPYFSCLSQSDAIFTKIRVYSFQYGVGRLWRSIPAGHGTRQRLAIVNILPSSLSGPVGLRHCPVHPIAQSHPQRGIWLRPSISESILLQIRTIDTLRTGSQLSFPLAWPLN